MKKLTPILAILLFVLAGCSGNKQTTDDFITVDVTASYPKKELILQDLFDIEYIPLETNDEFVTMAYMQAIGEEVLIVRNRVQMASDGHIFIFDKNGNALRRINRLGQGGDEYTFILGITLDEENSEMYVNDHRSGRVLVYDLLGNSKRGFRHASLSFRGLTSNFMENIFYDQIENLDRNNLILHEGTSDYDATKRCRFFIISKSDGSIIKEIEIPYKEKKSTMIRVTDANGYVILGDNTRNKELIRYRDKWILVEPSSDTIYTYSSDHVMKPFIVRTPSIQSMDVEVFLFPGVLTDRYYFMQSVKKEYDLVAKTAWPRTALIYDKQERKAFEYAVYNNDFTTKKTIDLVYDDIFLVNNTEIAFTKKIEAFELVEAYNKGELKDGRLKEIAATLDEESNPVIMLAKYKK